MEKTPKFWGTIFLNASQKKKMVLKKTVVVPKHYNNIRKLQVHFVQTTGPSLSR